MNCDAEIAGALLAAAQSEAGQVDPYDAIRAEIKDLRDRAKHIYQSAQYCDNGTIRRAEESQAQSLNIKASNLEKELNERLSVDEVKAVEEIKNLSDSEFVETDDFDGNVDSPAMVQDYIPPSKTGWDDPIVVEKPAIVQKTMQEYLDLVIPIQSIALDAPKNPEQSFMSKDKVRILKAVMAEFGCSAGDAESRIIAAFFKTT
jgi:hypothetical protein